MGHKLSKISLAVLSATALQVSSAALAQETATESSPDADLVEVIQVSGIRQSLTNALAEKRSSDNLIEVIQAVDIGKLPDQNLAEVLENVTGIQITRTAGIGTGVQIRGTNANRTEINGVSTVGSGSGRGGIDFEDVNASIISAVEVTKSPEAKTIEGSVGGTVNLRTIRPLELTETLGNIRVQGEDSSLTTDGMQPRISGAFGKNWETSSGKFGFVLSGSYTEQEATSFRPRVDRDGGLGGGARLCDAARRRALRACRGSARRSASMSFLHAHSSGRGQRGRAERRAWDALWGDLWTISSLRGTFVNKRMFIFVLFSYFGAPRSQGM